MCTGPDIKCISSCPHVGGGHKSLGSQKFEGHPETKHLIQLEVTVFDMQRPGKRVKTLV